MQSQLQIRREHDREAGYVLVGVIFLTVILLITLAIAAPKMAMSIQRDKELETIHRGEQYRRAIKLYYQKFGSYPTSIDQLVETNQIRFLRKKYTDPLTGKDDWKPVLFGQAHVRPLGFFGQPLLTAAVGRERLDVCGCADDDDRCEWCAGCERGSIGLGCDGRHSSGTRALGLRVQYGSAVRVLDLSGSSFGSIWLELWLERAPALDRRVRALGRAEASSGTFGRSSHGQADRRPVRPSDRAATSATTFGGGGPIVGFTLPVDKPSLIDYKQQKRYNKWEFNYDPAAEQAQAMAGLAGGRNTARTGLEGARIRDRDRDRDGAGIGAGADITPGQIPTIRFRSRLLIQRRNRKGPRDGGPSAYADLKT